MSKILLAHAQIINDLRKEEEKMRIQIGITGFDVLYGRPKVIFLFYPF